MPRGCVAPKGRAIRLPVSAGAHALVHPCPLAVSFPVGWLSRVVSTVPGNGLAKLLFSLDLETGVIQGHRASFGPGTQVQHGILKEET